MPYQNISIDDFKSLQQQHTITLIDIRDPQSFANGHIEGAIHVSNDTLAEFIENGDKSKPLVVCCYHGVSSQSAADFLNQQGFEDSYSLVGGYTAWAAQQS